MLQPWRSRNGSKLVVPIPSSPSPRQGAASSPGWAGANPVAQGGTSHPSTSASSQLKGSLCLPVPQASLPCPQLGAGCQPRPFCHAAALPTLPQLTAVLFFQEHFADVAGVDEAKEL